MEPCLYEEWHPDLKCSYLTIMYLITCISEMTFLLREPHHLRAISNSLFGLTCDPGQLLVSLLMPYGKTIPAIGHIS